MNATVVSPGINAALRSLELESSILELYRGVTYRVLGICIAAYVTWQFLLRSGALWNSKSEPPMLPYWVPGNAFVLRGL